MEKEIVIMTNTIKIEVDEGVGAQETLKEAIQSGFARILEVNVTLVTESGMVCDDMEIINELKQALMDGIMGIG